MKYLYFDNDDTESYVHNEEVVSKFFKRYDEYLKEFDEISEAFPKLFLREYKKCYFHDYSIQSFDLIHTKHGFEICLRFLNENNETIQITYHNVKLFSSQLNWNYRSDILYVEILKYDDKCFSQELSISSNETLYIIFKSLSFKKMNTPTISTGKDTEKA